MQRKLVYSGVAGDSAPKEDLCTYRHEKLQQPRHMFHQQLPEFNPANLYAKRAPAYSDLKVLEGYADLAKNVLTEDQGKLSGEERLNHMEVHRSFHQQGISLDEYLRRQHQKMPPIDPAFVSDKKQDYTRQLC